MNLSTKIEMNMNVGIYANDIFRLFENSKIEVIKLKVMLDITWAIIASNYTFLKKINF